MLRDKQNLLKRNRFHPKLLVLKLIVQNFPTKVKRKENKKIIWQPLYRYCKQVTLTRANPVVGKVLAFKLDNHRLNSHELEEENQEVKALIREWNYLFVDTGGILKRKASNHHQPVLPRIFRKVICHTLHQEMGDLGTEHVVQLWHQKLFWPRMQENISHFVTKVCSCLQRKLNVPIRAPLQSSWHPHLSSSFSSTLCT